MVLFVMESGLFDFLHSNTLIVGGLWLILQTVHQRGKSFKKHSISLRLRYEVFSKCDVTEDTVTYETR